MLLSITEQIPVHYIFNNWAESWEKGSLDCLSNQSLIVHARPLIESTCPLLWLKFPLNRIGSGKTMRMRWLAWTLVVRISLRKHAYSNILKIPPPKNWKFSDKNSDIFHISAQNIDCGYSLELPCWGSSNEYPQSMFLSRNKKIMYTPVNPSFTI